MSYIRPPAVAGAFYPGLAADLSEDIAALLADAAVAAKNSITPSRCDTLKALIVPHAGYIYSGTTAALAYQRLARERHRIRRVVLLGPVHRVPVHGLALPGAAAFDTPLGRIPMDLQSAAALAHLPQVVTSPAAHAQEHSLEVQLPFLQAVLNDFTLLPLAVGDATADEVAEVLEAVWGGSETMIVISSDLSHFLPYRSAQKMDQDTVQHILQLDSHITHAQACGGTPVNGLLLAAQKHHLQPELLGMCNSADTAGDKIRVVGYAALAFWQG